MAREAAIDLVGKFILSKEDLISKYYEAICGRILDTGVSVRKRVIKIFKEICMDYPGYAKIPEICVLMIRRINDEEGKFAFKCSLPSYVLNYAYSSPRNPEIGDGSLSKHVVHSCPGGPPAYKSRRGEILFLSFLSQLASLQ